MRGSGINSDISNWSFGIWHLSFGIWHLLLITSYSACLPCPRHLLQRGGTSYPAGSHPPGVYKSAEPPNGVPWEPAQRSGSSLSPIFLSAFAPQLTQYLRLQRWRRRSPTMVKIEIEPLLDRY